MKYADRTRTGSVTLLLVTLVLMVLGKLALGVTRIADAACRETGVLERHLDALAAADRAYAEAVSRLSATAWSERWFRPAEAAREVKHTKGGRVSTVLREVPQPERTKRPPTEEQTASTPATHDPLVHHRVDLFVRAERRGAEVIGCWRLFVIEDSMEARRHVVPVAFMFAPAGTELTEEHIARIADKLSTMMAARRLTDPDAAGRLTRLRRATGAAEIANLLALAGPPPADDGSKEPGRAWQAAPDLTQLAKDAADAGGER